MTGLPTARVDVEALYEALREELAELDPRVPAAVMRVFLEVSSRPCEERLWSLQFAFDEHDGRVARLEARFLDRRAAGPTDDDSLHGYEVDMTLPKILPSRAPSGSMQRQMESAHAVTSAALVASFERALVELGAYRTIEDVPLVSVDAYLL